MNSQRKKTIDVKNTASPIVKNTNASQYCEDICQKSRVPASVIQSEFASYNKTINVLPYPQLTENDFKNTYEIGRSFAEIFSECNFYKHNTSYKGIDKKELIPAYGNPNFSLALYTRKGIKCLLLVVSGNKTPNFKTTMKNIVNYINQNPTDLNITLKELLRIHNINKLNIVTHHSDISNEIITSHWDKNNSEPDLKIYSCSEPTLYRELIKLENDKAKIIGSAHFGLIMQASTEENKLKVHSFYSQSSCPPRCQMMHKANEYNPANPTNIAMNVSHSDRIKKKHRVDGEPRSVEILPRPFPSQPDQLLNEINKIEDEEQRLILLEKYSKNHLNIAHALEKQITNEISKIEYLELLKIVSGESNLHSSILNCLKDETLSKMVIINRILQLAIEKKEWVPVNRIFNANINSIISFLSKHDISIDNYEESDLFHHYVTQSFEAGVIPKISSFNIEQISALYSGNWKLVFDSIFSQEESLFAQSLIKKINLDNIYKNAMLKLREVIHIYFKENMNSVYKLITCNQAVKNNKDSIQKLIIILNKKLPEELKNLIRILNFDLSSYIKKWAGEIEIRKILNDNPLIYVEYLSSISKTLGTDCINDDTWKVIDIINQQKNLEMNDYDIQIQRKVVEKINTQVELTSNQLTKVNENFKLIESKNKSTIKPIKPIITTSSTKKIQSSINLSNKLKKSEKNELKLSLDKQQANIEKLNQMTKDIRALNIQLEKEKNILILEENKLNFIIEMKLNQFIRMYASILNLPETLVKILLNNNASNISSHVLQGLMIALDEAECVLFTSKRPKSKLELKLNIISAICEKLEENASNIEKYTLSEDSSAQLKKNIIYIDRLNDSVKYQVIAPCGTLITDTLSENDFPLSKKLNEMNLEELSTILLPTLSQRDHIIRSDAESIREIKLLIAKLARNAAMINDEGETIDEVVAEKTTADMTKVILPLQILILEKQYLAKREKFRFFTSHNDSPKNDVPSSISDEDNEPKYIQK